MNVLPVGVVANLDKYAEDIRKAISAHDLMQAFYDYAVEACTALDGDGWNKVANEHQRKYGTTSDTSYYELMDGMQVVSQYDEIIRSKYRKNTRQAPDPLDNGFEQDFAKSFEIYLASDKPPKDTKNDILSVASNTVYEGIDFGDMSEEELEDVDYEPTCPPIIPERDRVFFLDFHRTLKHILSDSESAQETNSDTAYALTFDNQRTLKINGVKIHDVNRGSEAHRILTQAFKNNGRDSVMEFKPRIRNLQQTMLNIGLPKEVQGLFFPVLHTEGGNFHNPITLEEMKKAGVPPLNLAQFENPVKD